MKATAWSKVILVVSTVLVAYSLLLLAAHHCHHGHHGPPAHAQFKEGPHHGHGPHHPHPLLALNYGALLVGITGMVAACTERRRLVRIFMLLLLVLEVAIMLHAGSYFIHRFHECQEKATKVAVSTTVREVNLPGVTLVEESSSVSDPFVDRADLEHCQTGTRHALFMFSLAMAVLFSSILHCSGRFIQHSRQEEEEELHQPQLMVVGTAIQKEAAAVPNQSEEEEETVLITRV